MKFLTAAVAAMLLGVGGAGRAEEPDKGATKDDLPGKDKIAWEVKAFEGDADSFTLLKRTVDKEKMQATWLLEVNSAAAATRANDNGNFNNIGYFALFHDEDGVVIKRVKIVTEPGSGVRKGDRVRASLKMPAEDVTAKTVKVVIKYLD